MAEERTDHCFWEAQLNSLLCFGVADVKYETGEKQVLYLRQCFENRAGERVAGILGKYWNREQEAGGFAISAFVCIWKHCKNNFEINKQINKYILNHEIY